MRFLLALWIALNLGIATRLPREAPAESVAPDPAWIEAKCDATLETVAELRRRPTGHLAPDQVQARLRALDALEDYARRRRFTVNAAFPGRPVPHFIDDRGTRCALAHVIEASGRGDLLQDLAAADNNAFISQLEDHEELTSWLATNGFSAEDVAFIQAPGYWPPETPPPPPEPRSPVTPTPEPPAAETPGADPSAPPPALRPGAAAPGSRSGAGVSRSRPMARGRKSSSTGGSLWERWWDHRRDEFLSTRARWHGAAARATPPAGDGYERAPARGLRPDPAEIRASVLPALEALAAEDEHFAATALMAMARCATPADADPIRARLHRHLAAPAAAHRPWALLALAWLGGSGDRAALLAVAGDTAAGRKLLSRSSAVPEDERAYAALGLARCGDAAAAATLMAVLAAETGELADFRAAAVTALGVLSAAPVRAPGVAPWLAARLAEASWPEGALAQIPLALARSGDRAALPAILDISRKFKGPAVLRRSAAAALGRSDAGFDRAVVESLLAVARRDPDAGARQHAAGALGELAARAPATADAELLGEVATFLHDGITGFFDQPADRPLHALAAGLFARAHRARAAELTLALIGMARESASRDDRAAAVVGLGLAANAAARTALRGLFDGDQDPVIRGYAAEALGLHGDGAAAARLLDLATTSPSEWIRLASVRALAAVAEPSMLEPLVAALAAAKSEPVRAALTRALGEIGDRNAIPALLAVAGDRSAGSSARERAAAALGRIGQEEDVSWTLRLRPGLNFTAPAPAVAAVSGAF